MGIHLHPPARAMPVQELVLSGEAIIPDRYVLKDGEVGSSAGSIPLMNVPPIIDAAFLSSSSSRNELNKLYSALTSWGEALHEYTLKLKGIVDLVLKAMALSLNLDENCFLDLYKDKRSMVARFNYYHPRPRPELVFGLKLHADGSAMTIVLPDKEVEGVQYLKDNEWFRVTINQKALLINIDDQLEIIGNGVFKSPIHRAVASAEHASISLAMFCSPDPSKEIGPLDELVSKNTLRLYKNATEYLKTYFKHYQLGRRPIGSVKL